MNSYVLEMMTSTIPASMKRTLAIDLMTIFIPKVSTLAIAV
jgi:hypothetical protein